MTAVVSPPRVGAMDSLADLPRRTARRRRGELFPAEPANWKIAVTVAAIVLGIVLAWELLADAGIVSVFFWSKPSMIWRSLLTNITKGSMIADIRFTFTSTILGFVIGVLGGAIVGLSFWWSRFYAKVAEPLLIALEAMPKLALAPMIVLALGIGLPSKVAMATAIVIIIQILNAHAAVRHVDRDEQTLLYSLGASRWQVFTKVVFPATLPHIIASFRVAIGLALTGAIVGEYVGSQNGLGKMIQLAASTFDISLIWVGVFTLAVMAFLLYIVVGVIERILIRLIRG
ncbi:ABC transporter permease [Gryllotalpicola protaetiae]|uniref:ABC transporter permease n=1 Tax=Gryllotalpicola protaetiae TaxID=2419771 RepID=A0A387BM70_9MICO|nr:ABC transporter permease [Gryllotalpicola protaetiae]AYG02299.1 ABC transporter permease [Gryllotalpicola protaetiae]